MKPIVQFASKRTLMEVIEIITEGTENKFMPLIAIDLSGEKEETILVLALGDMHMSHKNITITVRDITRRKNKLLHFVELVGDLNGGGSITIRNSTLIFHGMSGDFGKYNLGLLQKIDQEELKKIFEVDLIEFR